MDLLLFNTSVGIRSFHTSVETDVPRQTCVHILITGMATRSVDVRAAASVVRWSAHSILWLL